MRFTVSIFPSEIKTATIHGQSLFLASKARGIYFFCVFLVSRGDLGVAGLKVARGLSKINEKVIKS